MKFNDFLWNLVSVFWLSLLSFCLLVIMLLLEIWLIEFSIFNKVVLFDLEGFIIVMNLFFCMLKLIFLSVWNVCFLLYVFEICCIDNIVIVLFFLYLILF